MSDSNMGGGGWGGSTVVLLLAGWRAAAGGAQSCPSQRGWGVIKAQRPGIGWFDPSVTHRLGGGPIVLGAQPHSLESEFI